MLKRSGPRRSNAGSGSSTEGNPALSPGVRRVAPSRAADGDSDADFEFHTEAVAEARATFVWYEQRDARAAAAFLMELDQAVARVLEAPETWPVFLGRTRRCLFDRFPFFLNVYRQIGERIEVLAVAHAKRRPGYWRTR